MSTSAHDDRPPAWVVPPQDVAPPPEVHEPAEPAEFDPDAWQGPPSQPEPDLGAPAPARREREGGRSEVHSGVWEPPDPEPGIDAPVTPSTLIAPSGEQDAGSLGSDVADIDAAGGDGLESDTDRIGYEKTSTGRRPGVGVHGTRGKLPPGRGVQWVRASDLLSQDTGRIAGRGISFQEALARRIRGVGAATAASAGHGVAQAARRLPPPSAFGRGAGRDAAATRSPVGMS